MRAIEQSSRFRRDFKHVIAGESGKIVRQELSELLLLLATDAKLPERLRDHALSGEWKGFRDCHLRPDLVLIYRKPDSSTLELARMGSHSELF